MVTVVHGAITCLNGRSEDIQGKEMYMHIFLRMLATLRNRCASKSELFGQYICAGT
jgi:hypothetical protein